MVIGRRLGLTAFVSVLSLFVACGVITAPQPRAIASIGPVDAFECAVPQDVWSFLATPPPTPPALPRPSRGTVPDMFHPVKAVVCDSYIGPRVDADGTATYFERSYAGNLEAAIKAINAPSARRTPPFMCSTYSIAAPVDMWLVDADGRAVEPSYPLSDCGFDNTIGLYEISMLAEVEAVEHEVRIDTAGISLFFNCSRVYAPPVEGVATGIDSSAYGSLSFCRFDLSGPAPVFLGAQRNDALDQVPYRDFLEFVPSEPCSRVATAVATTSWSGSIYTDGMPAELVIELDGCQRILVDGYAPVAAPAELIEVIVGQ